MRQSIMRGAREPTLARDPQLGGLNFAKALTVFGLFLGIRDSGSQVQMSIPEANVSRFIVFDFDGVLADSEILSNKVLAEMVSELGVPTTLEDSFRLYMGKRFDEVIAAVEAAVGRPLPGFADDYPRRIAECFRRDLRPVDGARAFLDTFVDLPRCIASSSSPERLKLSLDVLGFEPMFGDNVFSASQVTRGKPHPDIFLFAAERMGMNAARGIVIEASSRLPIFAMAMRRD
jgi:beta-phosphoglucomutase-like phosphatase (HAD superfamily)